MNKWISIAISALSDFVLAAGGAFLAIGGTTLPTTYQLSVCGVTGALNAARGVQKNMSPAIGDVPSTARPLVFPPGGPPVVPHP